MKSVCLLAVCLWSTFVHATPKVHEYQLDNGMKVLVKEDHRAPIAVSQVWYKIGASYETPGITGLSHWLEHMMFKGTETHGPNAFSRIIAALGGSENAFTGRDYTAYFETLSKDHLRTAFALEADRMANLRILPEEAKKELEVVKEERRWRTDDKPTARTQEEFNAVAYRELPYRNPVIGWMNDLEHLTVADLKDWYAKWYAPNNATLVVVGDVEPDAVFALASATFGRVAARETGRPKPAAEPRQLGETRVKVRLPAKQPYLIMGFKTPSLRTADTPADAYALEMLAHILAGGDSARLSRQLVRGSEIAAEADADYGLYDRLAGMLTLDGTPTDGHGLDDLEQALLGQVRALIETPVSETELEHVRVQLIAGKVYELDSVFYQAMQLGMLETVGLGWRRADEYIQAMKSVTAEQVRAVAKRYLTHDNLTISRLEPLPLKPGQRINTGKPGGAHVR